MPDIISRRRFLRHASLGTAVVGAVAAGGASVFGAAGTASAASASPSSPDAPVLDGSGVIAHVTDARKGEISILVGTREIKYTNRDMAQQLLKAAQ